jgi:BirA family biotin operon repressor/biotin-[acetyl-CoA-carboxylase] ligase
MTGYNKPSMFDSSFLEAEIAAKTFISETFFLPEIGSTNEFAKSLPPGKNTLVVADYQTWGKGRLARKWESKRGKNLTFTIRASFNVGRRESQAINFFFSYYLLASVEAYVRQLPGSFEVPDFELKWPNDLLSKQKKLAGLLIESCGQNDFIVGIGLNVNQISFMAEYNDKTTSLSKLTGATIDRKALLVRIVQEFDRNLYLLHNKQFDEVYELWLSRCKMVGRRIDFKSSNYEIKAAEVIGILKDGGILLRIEEKEYLFYSGEISIKHS